MFNIESPVDGGVATDRDDHLLLRGWVLAEGLSATKIVVRRSDDDFAGIASDIERPDVIEYIYKTDSANHPLLRCGFELLLADWREGFKVYLQHSGGETEIASVSFSPSKRALAGAHLGIGGWLFLADDTNGSQDQFEGKKLIEKSELSRWKQYFQDIEKISAEAVGVMKFLSTPSKEFLLPGFYPLARGEMTVADQLETALFRRRCFINGSHIMSDAPELCLRKGDTHWSDYGAWVCFRYILRQALGESFPIVEPVFRAESEVGDLGSKCHPPVAHVAFRSIQNPDEYLSIFSNGIQNGGNIQILKSMTVKNGLKCMIVGGSSAAQLLIYAVRHFEECVFVHANASIDPQLVRDEKPSLLILQQSQRFMIVAPRGERRIHEDLRLKLRNESRSRVLELKLIVDSLASGDKHRYIINAHREVIASII